MNRTNYKLHIINKCPKCYSSSIALNFDIQNSMYSVKKIKNFKWKKTFSKTEKTNGTYYFDQKIGPILKSQCRIFEEAMKNPQKTKMRISPVLHSSNIKLNKTFNEFYCNECGYHEFIENANYIDVMKQKWEI